MTGERQTILGTVGIALASVTTALNGAGAHQSHSYRAIGQEHGSRYDVAEVRYVEGADTVPVILEPIVGGTLPRTPIEADAIVDFADVIASPKDQRELLAVVSDHPDVLAALRESLAWVDRCPDAHAVRIEADRRYDGPAIRVRVDSSDDMDVWQHVTDEFTAWWFDHYDVDMFDHLHVSIW